MRTWVYAIARRCALDELRRRRREPGGPAEVPGTLPQEALGALRVELRQDVALALGSLPERERDALIAFAWHGTAREAAHALGLPLGTLKSRVYRGRERLRGLR